MSLGRMTRTFLSDGGGDCAIVGHEGRVVGFPLGEAVVEGGKDADGEFVAFVGDAFEVE